MASGTHKYFISLLLYKFYMFCVYVHPAHFLGMQVFLQLHGVLLFREFGLVFLAGFLFCLFFGFLVSWVFCFRGWACSVSIGTSAPFPNVSPSETVSLL